MFRRKSRIADLCLQLANKFKRLLEVSPQLRRQYRGMRRNDDNGDPTEPKNSPLPLNWTKDWYNRFSVVLMQELASFSQIFTLIKQKGDAMVE